MTKVKRLTLDRYEHGLLVRALYEEWHRMLAEGKPTEDIEDLILKVIDAPAKKFREVLNMNELTFHRDGDYLIPDLLSPLSPQIGRWGQRRKRYLQQYHSGIYTGLLLSGKLNAHLEEIDRSAKEMFELLMKQYAARKGVTEQLKAENQMEWVRRMNNIRARAEEVVYAQLIHD